MRPFFCLQSVGIMALPFANNPGAALFRPQPPGQFTEIQRNPDPPTGCLPTSLSMSSTDDVIISPRRTPGDPVLPPAGLFFVNPFEAKLAASLARQHNMASHHFFNSQLFSCPATEAPFFIAGPAVGAPMAVLCLEKLIACGARTVIAMGWCGALQPSLAMGSMVLPTWAHSDEGTSAHYPLKGRAISDAGLRQELTSFLQPRFPSLATGQVWTTDAPYRETRSRIQKIQAEGVLAADMEFAALNTVAAFRGISFAAVMLVSDLLYSQDWHPSFHTKPFKRYSRDLVEQLFDFSRRPRPENY